MSARLGAWPCALLTALVAGTAVAETPPAPVPDGAATATKRVNPKYPKTLLDKGIDGCVLLSFGIDAEGRGRDFQVLDSQPKGAFDQATLKVMDQWRFQPPAREGRYAYLVQYRIDGRAPANVCQPLPTFAALNPDAPPLTREVRLLEAVMPNYSGVRDAPDGGCVTVRMQVKYDGFVGDVTVLEARPESLGPPTVAAVKQWHFDSFPPPDMYTTQTFNFTPELVRLPENAIRTAYLETDGGSLRSVGCQGKAVEKKAVENKVDDKKAAEKKAGEKP